MTLPAHRHDAHHDLTWLIGAVARTLFVQAHDDAAVMDALHGIAACNFDDQPIRSKRRMAAACKWLPVAAVEALEVAEEPAMALAASLQHLDWQPLPATDGEAARARVLGAAGPLNCPRAALSLLICEPGASATLPRDNGREEPHARVLFILAGEVAFTDAHGARRHARAGKVVPWHGETCRSSGKDPLLAVLLEN